MSHAIIRNSNEPFSVSKFAWVIANDHHHRDQQGGGTAETDNNATTVSDWTEGGKLVQLKDNYECLVRRNLGIHTFKL